MNWARGLFRLWMILSFFWIVFSLGTTETYDKVMELFKGEELPINATSAELDFDGIEDGTATITFQGRVLEVDTSGVEPGDPEWNSLLDATARWFNQDAARVNAESRLRLEGEINGALRMAFVPPFLLLLLAIALIWALKGFKRN